MTCWLSYLVLRSSSTIFCVFHEQKFFSKPIVSRGRFIFLFLFWMMSTAMASGPCQVVESSEAPSHMMVRSLTGDCSEGDRQSLAVPAQDILAALQAGLGVELHGVMLAGDLMLDALPLVSIPQGQSLPSLVQEQFDREQVTEVRLIKGPLIFHQVDVQGILATNLVHRGYVIVQGPVSIKESTFRRSVDFSRAIFLDEVDVSETTIGYEGFFIRAFFHKDVDFQQTAFGTHTRFHKAVFAGDVKFKKAGFHGLAEFLEVTFHQDTDFSKTRFVQGTGFSGSQFRQEPDFSESRFEREAFFRFTQFEKGALFRGSVFRDTADFSEATFGEKSDFSRSLFEEPPQFTDEELAAQFNAVSGLQDPKTQAGLFVLAGLILVFFYFVFRKSEGKGSE